MDGEDEETTHTLDQINAPVATNQNAWDDSAGPGISLVAFGFDAMFEDTSRFVTQATRLPTFTTQSIITTSASTVPTTTTSSLPTQCVLSVPLPHNSVSTSITSTAFPTTTNSDTSNSSSSLSHNNTVIKASTPKQPQKRPHTSPNKNQKYPKKPASENLASSLHLPTVNLSDTSSSEPDTSSTNSNTNARPQLPPPLALQDSQYFPAIRRQLLTFKLDKSFTAFTNSKKRTVEIQTYTLADYTKIKDYLTGQKYNFNTWRPKQEKTIRVIIRGLVIDTDIDELKAALTEKGFQIKQVLQLRKNGKENSRNAIPLFLVEAVDNKVNKKLYSLTKILSQCVTVEPERWQGPPICSKCLSFGHSHNNCFRKPKCALCGGDHEISTCTHNPKTPSCGNCKGNHRGTWRGCPSYQRFLSPQTHKEGPPANENQSRPFPQIPQANAWKSSTNGNFAPGSSSRPPGHPVVDNQPQPSPIQEEPRRIRTQPTTPLPNPPSSTTQTVPPPQNPSPANPPTSPTDLLTGIREIMSFVGELRGLINTTLALIRAYKSGGLTAVFTTLEQLLSGWQIRAQNGYCHGMSAPLVNGRAKSGTSLTYINLRLH